MKFTRLKVHHETDFSGELCEMRFDDICSDSNFAPYFTIMGNSRATIRPTLEEFNLATPPEYHDCGTFICYDPFPYSASSIKHLLDTSYSFQNYFEDYLFYRKDRNNKCRLPLYVNSYHSLQSLIEDFFPQLPNAIINRKKEQPYKRESPTKGRRSKIVNPWSSNELSRLRRALEVYFALDPSDYDSPATLRDTIKEFPRDEDEAFCEILSILLGGTWTCEEIHGYCQGDWNCLYYDTTKIDPKTATVIEELYFGLGVEVEFFEDDNSYWEFLTDSELDSYRNDPAYEIIEEDD